MPHAGVSTEFVEACEDDIARFITAQEHTQGIQALIRILMERNALTHAYAADVQESLTYIADMLRVGKSYAARARRGVYG